MITPVTDALLDELLQHPQPILNLRTRLMIAIRTEREEAVERVLAQIRSRVAAIYSPDYVRFLEVNGVFANNERGDGLPPVITGRANLGVGDEPGWSELDGLSPLEQYNREGR